MKIYSQAKYKKYIKDKAKQLINHKIVKYMYGENMEGKGWKPKIMKKQAEKDIATIHPDLRVEFNSKIKDPLYILYFKNEKQPKFKRKIFRYIFLSIKKFFKKILF